jgi:ureidoglycolate lyase
MKTLPLRPIDAQAFAPYGWLADAQGRGGRPINDGSSLRVDGVGELHLHAAGGRPCLAIFRAQARHPQGPWSALERHALGTQSFVPMGGARYVVLVALGAPGEHTPDPATLAAFVVSGTQAVTLRAGTWHHGLIALDEGDFVVIERTGDGVDCDLATLAEPVRLVPAA